MRWLAVSPGGHPEVEYTLGGFQGLELVLKQVKVPGSQPGLQQIHTMAPGLRE